MADEVTEKKQDRPAPEETPERKGKLSRGHLTLIAVGVAAAAFFVALIVWISLGAKVKEEKKKTDLKDIKVEVETKFSPDGRLCTVTLPKLERKERKTVVPKIELVKVEAGKFTMSAPVTRGRERKVAKERGSKKETLVGNEIPHEVEIKNDFYIGKTEVTQAQWMAVMGIKDNGAEDGKAKKSYFTVKADKEHPEGGDDMPVEMVTWNEAMRFCERLNKFGFAPKGWKFTLPAEAQWEFAARGGKLSKGYKFSGGDKLEEVAWCKSNIGEKKNRPVAKKKPNELGLFDMNGNVWEWCLDDFAEDNTASPAEFLRQVDPKTGAVKGPSSAFRVIRGGSWYTSDAACTPTVRSPMSPAGYGLFLGFRVALVKDPAAGN